MRDDRTAAVKGSHCAPLQRSSLRLQRIRRPCWSSTLSKCSLPERPATASTVHSARRRSCLQPRAMWESLIFPQCRMHSKGFPFQGGCRCTKYVLSTRAESSSWSCFVQSFFCTFPATNATTLTPFRSSPAVSFVGSACSCGTSTKVSAFL